ncbi:MAG: molecular chaperone TorD family protein [Chloroflexi bacterium]|nr:molecular chaperone TorD family protein [Chloroflexota bacterium]
MLSSEDKRFCELFAGLLDYPDGSLPGAASRLAGELARSHSPLAGAAQSFAAFAWDNRLEALEELYTQTFDATPATTLYFGYHLFGETPRRSAFLVKLQEAYIAASFSGGAELADHLGVLLRYLAVAGDRDFAAPLLEECLLPVMARLVKELKSGDNPYSLLMTSLTGFLQHLSLGLMKTGGVSHA